MAFIPQLTITLAVYPERMEFSVDGELSPKAEADMDARWQAHCARVLAGTNVPFRYEGPDE